MKEAPGDKARLEHILESTRLILKFVEGVTFDEFMQNQMMFAACVRHLEIIGEASSKLTPELRTANPQLLWSSMISMRNILIHNYFGMSETVIWKTIEEDLETLESQIQTILQKFD